MKSEDKKSVRATVIRQRQELPPAELTVRSERAVKNLQKLLNVELPTGFGPDAKKNQVSYFALYRPMQGEPVLASFERWLQGLGFTLLYPRITDNRSEKGPKQAQMEFCPPDAGFVRGPLGIMQPAPQAPVIPPAALAGILVPGVAFAQGGQRLGMGKGFYDRYLSLAPAVPRMVIALGFQVFEIPPWQPDPWDELMDFIATEKDAFRVQRQIPGEAKGL